MSLLCRVCAVHLYSWAKALASYIRTMGFTSWEFPQEANFGDDAEVMSCSAMDLHIGTADIRAAKIVFL